MNEKELLVERGVGKDNSIIDLYYVFIYLHFFPLEIYLFAVNDFDSKAAVYV